MGSMGAAMAKKAVEFGDFAEVIVWNRSPAKVDAFMADVRGDAALAPRLGAVRVRRAPSLGELAEATDVIVLMLMGDESTQEVVDQLVSRARGAEGERPREARRRLLVNCATLSPACVDRIAARIGSELSGWEFCNCPVTGRPEHAMQRALCSWISTGEEKESQTPKSGEGIAELATSKVASCWSKRSKVISTTDVTASAKYKLATNFLVYGCAELLGESLVLLDSCGIERAHLLEFCSGMLGGTFPEIYARKMVQREFTGEHVGASVDVGLKDVGMMKGLLQDQASNASGDQCSSSQSSGTGQPDKAASASNKRSLPMLEVLERNMKAQKQKVGDAASQWEWCSFLEQIEK